MKGFWSSVELTGSQTSQNSGMTEIVFWSSVELTGSQTIIRTKYGKERFGAVSN